MHPKLFELPELPYVGSITVYSYGVLLAAAYLVGLQLAIIRARRRGLDDGRIMDLGIYIIVSALVGAKLMLLVVDWQHFSRNPSEMLSLVRSGGVFYGGLILAVVVALWYLRRHKMPVWTTCDVFAPGIALGHVVGRLGCLLAGCCFGKQTTVPWAITFTNPFAAANVGTPLGVPLHPTQLYEAGAELLILIFLLVVEKRGRPFPGRTFWGYMLLYGVSRFVIEFYRGDERGMVFNWLPTSQFISMLLVPLSLIMLWRLSRGGEPSVPTQRAQQKRAA
jgi:phosphatidylglycerol:prolipoprotein diacylglycerol transferase